MMNTSSSNGTTGNGSSLVGGYNGSESTIQQKLSETTANSSNLYSSNLANTGGIGEGSMISN